MRHPDYNRGDLDFLDVARIEALLAEPAETDQARQLGRCLAAVVDALLDEVGQLVPSRIDRRRLRDGAAALTLATNIAGKSRAEVEGLRSQLLDGALALQSLDDLGTAEENATAAADLKELQRRLFALDQLMPVR